METPRSRNSPEALYWRLAALLFFIALIFGFFASYVGWKVFDDVETNKLPAQSARTEDNKDNNGALSQLSGAAATLAGSLAALAAVAALRAEVLGQRRVLDRQMKVMDHQATLLAETAALEAHSSTISTAKALVETMMKWEELPLGAWTLPAKLEDIEAHLRQQICESIENPAQRDLAIHELNRWLTATNDLEGAQVRLREASQKLRELSEEG